MMHPEDEYSDDEIKRRYKFYFGDDNKRVLGGEGWKYPYEKKEDKPEKVIKDLTNVSNEL